MSKDVFVGTTFINRCVFIFYSRKGKFLYQVVKIAHVKVN